MTEMLAIIIAQHALENHHPIRWEEISVVDRDRQHRELLLLLKVALHIQMTSAEITSISTVEWNYTCPADGWQIKKQLRCSPTPACAYP